MFSSQIRNENEYSEDVSRARRLTFQDKIDICPNYSYAFYGDFELYLNSYFSDPADRWFLIFSEISPRISRRNPSNRVENHSSVAVEYSRDFCDIFHNTKLKYQCEFCQNEWTSMQGQISFRIPLPLLNSPFVLFVDISSQQCQFCSRHVNPSCYLDEVTRIMKLTSRFILEKFYSYRRFHIEEMVEENSQRTSQTRGHHQHHLCRACQRGFCWQCR